MSTDGEVTLATMLRNATQVKKLAKDAKRIRDAEMLRGRGLEPVGEGKAPRTPIRN